MLIAHVIHRFDIGGMENGLVNLINHMPRDRYRHAIVSLTDSTSFRDRIERSDVDYYSLHKKPGQDLGLYVRLWRLFRRLKPTIVHTRNLASLEAVFPAALAGVPFRVHGEHGRDVQDIDGTKRRYRWLRRALAPLVQRFIALSGDLEIYLVKDVGIAASKVVRITNGVDTDKFCPVKRDAKKVVIGSVTRMQDVKDPLTLARAFVKLVSDGRFGKVRLVIVGDGPLLSRIAELVRESGVEEFVSLPGSRDDVSEQLQGFDVFSLSSRVGGDLEYDSRGDGDRTSGGGDKGWRECRVGGGRRYGKPCARRLGRCFGERAWPLRQRRRPDENAWRRGTTPCRARVRHRQDGSALYRLI